LVLGDGVEKKEFTVTVINCMLVSDVKTIFEANWIVIGVIVTNENVIDTLNGWIYKQNPERFDQDKRIQHIRSGQTMDVWLQLDKPAKDSIDKPSPIEL